MLIQDYLSRPSRGNYIISNSLRDEFIVVLSHSQGEPSPFVVDMLVDSPHTAYYLNRGGFVVEVERNEVGGSLGKGKGLAFEIMLIQDNIRLSAGKTKS